MNFLFPEILWALSLLAIPIIVHLFNFRRFKRIDFSNVSFLREVKQETQSKSRIKHLIILASRMLALSCIVLAFAQPYFHDDNQQVVVGTKVVGIYIDNSFSMDAENSDGRLMDLARNKALEIVDAYAPTDQFLLVTNDFEGRHQRLANQEEISEWIDEIEISPHVRRLSSIIARQNDLLSKTAAAAKVSFIISDLQKSSHDFAACHLDSSIQYTLVPNLAIDASNVYIDSIWFDSPARQINQAEKLNIRIRNSSERALSNIPLKLWINGSQKAIGSFDVTPGLVTDTCLFYTNTETGFINGMVKIADHPVTFDDQFFFGYHVAEQIDILEIRGQQYSSNHVSSVFEDDVFFKFDRVSESSVDFGVFGNANLIILNGLNTLSSGLSNEVVKFCENGGSVLVFPGQEVDLDSYSKLTTDMNMGVLGSLVVENTKVSDINLDHYLYNDVFENLPDNIDLPVIQSYYPISSSSRSIEKNLLTMRNNKGFLATTDVVEGKFFFCAVPLSLESSNFIQHALFVTTLIRIAEFSEPSGKLYYTIGSDEKIRIPQVRILEEEALHIVGNTHKLDFLPSHKHLSGKTELNVHGQIQESGNYDILLAGEKLAGASFNFSREESELAFLDESQALQIIEDAGLTGVKLIDSDLSTIAKSIGELDKGKILWRLLVLLTLIFLAIEILLIKFWK